MIKVDIDANNELTFHSAAKLGFPVKEVEVESNVYVQ